MNEPSTATRSVIVERDIPFPPEKIWRALTQPHLIEEWLVKNEFKPEIGHRFSLRIDPQPNQTFSFDCEVLTVEPNKTLSYTWNSAGDQAANGLRSAVTWTLTPTKTGTRLRMEQSGFRPDQPLFYGGARAGWQEFVARLEQLLGRMD